MLSVSQHTTLASQWVRTTASIKSDSRLACFLQDAEEMLSPRLFPNAGPGSFQFSCAYTFQAFKSLLSPKIPFFNWDASFKSILQTTGASSWCFPFCPCGVVFAGCQGRSLLNLAQQFSNCCSCSQDSWVLTDKQRCWYLNPSPQPKPLITLSYDHSLLLSLLNLWQPEVAWPIAILSCYNKGRMLGSVLLLMLRPAANAMPGWWSMAQAVLPCWLHGVAKILLLGFSFAFCFQFATAVVLVYAIYLQLVSFYSSEMHKWEMVK